MAKKKTDKAGYAQQHTEHDLGAVFIDQHAHHDTRRNGQRHIQNQQGFDLLVIKTKRIANRDHQWCMVKPDHEGNKKCHPGQMERAGLTAER
jgi:hypothetical protein